MNRLAAASVFWSASWLATSQATCFDFISSDNPAPIALRSITNISARVLEDDAQSKEQLRKIAELRNNWDGYGGLAMEDSTIKHANDALEILLRHGLAPELTPNSNGTISFEWATSVGDAHIEFGRSRFVGNIRPFGADRIPVTGNSLPVKAFYDKVNEIANLLAENLYPSTVPKADPLNEVRLVESATSSWGFALAA